MAVAVVLLVVTVGIMVMSRKRYRFRIRTRQRRDQGHPHPPTPHFTLPTDVHSAVAKQHLHLHQGGLLSEAALEAKKADLQRLLDRGDLESAESALKPGLDYVVQIRALTEIGSEAAGQLLERQLNRSLSDDPIEQGWYWVDVARGLRDIHRIDHLPILLHYADSSRHFPLAALFAGELVAYPNFVDCLISPDETLARPARRVMISALEGLRKGELPLALFGEAQLGEVVSRFVGESPGLDDPTGLRLAMEALRLLRRSEHAERFVHGDLALQELLHWQYACLSSVEARMSECLLRAQRNLPFLLGDDPTDHWADRLHLLDQLRVDAGNALLDLLEKPDFAHRIEALRCLRWSRDPLIVPQLCQRLRQCEQSPRERHDERVVILETFKHHPCAVVERELIRQLKTASGQVRFAAIRSLGWWEPIHRDEVVELLHYECALNRAETRWRAESALARLGDRAALDRIRRRLTSEQPDCVREVIRLIADEGINWLWPDLDRLVDAEDLDIAFEACEALEQMRECLLGPLAG